VTLGAALVLVLVLGWFVWMLRRGRSQVAEGMREVVYTQDWSPFVSGYLAALDDIERTGLRPTAEDTQRRSAERAFRRRYIERPS
jgi:hypothetical protein